MLAQPATAKTRARDASAVAVRAEVRSAIDADVVMQQPRTPVPLRKPFCRIPAQPQPLSLAHAITLRAPRHSQPMLHQRRIRRPLSQQRLRPLHSKLSHRLYLLLTPYALLLTLYSLLAPSLCTTLVPLPLSTTFLAESPAIPLTLSAPGVGDIG